MSKVAILTHEFDKFRFPGAIWQRRAKYMMQDIAHILRRRGHQITVCRGPAQLVPADLLIVHVDCTDLPKDYIDAIQTYPVHINGNVTSINKRSYSGLLVDPNSDWAGEVMVKSARNFDGGPESALNKRARKLGKPEPFPQEYPPQAYAFYDRICDVDDHIWSNPGVIVEKFIPERFDDSYATRYYVFAGQYERCTLHLSHQKIVKGIDIHHSEPVEVPHSLRELRHAMGFDYGKFDFVMNGDTPYLLDANKTMGAAGRNGAFTAMVKSQNTKMADAVEAMLP